MLTDAIDWALKENIRKGSPYYGRIDATQIAVSGWSCGGVQALQVGAGAFHLFGELREFSARRSTG